MGNDLGAGSYDGCYQNNVNNYMTSPSVNMTGFINPEIHFRRRLAVRNGDTATIQYNCGSGFYNLTSWTNVSDTSWQDIVITMPSGYCDNVSNMQIRFRLQSNNANNSGGWTIDNFYICGYYP
jgi:hypothetical protein